MTDGRRGGGVGDSLIASRVETLQTSSAASAPRRGGGIQSPRSAKSVEYLFHRRHRRRIASELHAGINGGSRHHGPTKLFSKERREPPFGQGASYHHPSKRQPRYPGCRARHTPLNGHVPGTGFAISARLVA